MFFLAKPQDLHARETFPPSRYSSAPSVGLPPKKKHSIAVMDPEKRSRPTPQ